jgi:hypothetical protein
VAAEERRLPARSLLWRARHVAQGAALREGREPLSIALDAARRGTKAQSGLAPMKAQS